MTLKFDCRCGTRIGLDVEPEEGRMPTSLDCPSCGADVTELANGEIAVQRAASTAAAPARPSMRIVRHAGPAAAAADSPAPAAPVQAEPAAAPRKAPPRPARTESKPPGFLARNALSLAGLAVLGGIGFWIWFALAVSKPRPVFHLETTAAAPFLDARLLDAGRLLILTPNRISLRNIVTDTDLWSAEVQAPERRKPAAPKEARHVRSDEAEDPDFVPGDFEGIRMRIAGKSAWVRAGAKLLQFDVGTGRTVSETALPEPVLQERPDAAGWLFVSQGPDGQQVLTRIDFATAKPSTARFVPPVRPVIAYVEGDTGPHAEPMVVQLEGTVALLGRLLEVSIASLRPADTGKPSVIEKENLRASDSDAAGAEFVRNNQDYAIEDLSKYEVTLRRPFGGTPWKGTVVGHPVFVTLPSVDLLIAGKTVIAFDHAGTKLWQAVMGNTLSQRHQLTGQGDDDEGAPAFEAGGRAYVIDRGTVHAFGLRTGEPAWRLPTVGASEVVQSDTAVYIATTSAGPEAMNLADPRSGRGVRPLLLCVDPANGAVRWQAEWLADHAAVSGPFVYGWRAGTSALDEMAASMNQTTARSMLHLSRLDPSNGRADWTWHRSGTPRSVEAVGNRILVHRTRELTVLGFRTF
jgi:PQQ-like domain